MKLTVNQLVLFLQIARGTLDREYKIGTYDNDITVLLLADLIESYKGGFDYRITEHGNEVMHICQLSNETYTKTKSKQNEV